MWEPGTQGQPQNRSTRCAQASIQTEFRRLSLPELTSGAMIARVAEVAPIAAGKFKCRGIHSKKSEVIVTAFIDDRRCLFKAKDSFACSDFTASGYQRIEQSLGMGS